MIFSKTGAEFRSRDIDYPLLHSTFTALKGFQFYFYLLLLQLVLCHVAALKVYRTSSLVQIMFSFWTFEISDGVLRNQKIIIGLDSFSNQQLIYLAPFGLY